jgi:hypothetical protein
MSTSVMRCVRTKTGGTYERLNADAVAGFLRRKVVRRVL